MPKLTQETQQLRRTTIIQAALTCFRQQGIQKTSIADIAKEAGIATGSIYTHFPNRHSLLLGTAQSLFTTRLGTLEDSPVAPEPIHIIQQLIDPKTYYPGRADLLLELLAEAGRDETLARILNESLLDNLSHLWKRSLSAHTLADTSQIEALIPVMISYTIGYIAQSTLTRIDPASYTDTISLLLTSITKQKD